MTKAIFLPIGILVLYVAGKDNTLFVGTVKTIWNHVDGLPFNFCIAITWF